MTNLNQHDVSKSLDQSVATFVGTNTTYYETEFTRIQGKVGFSGSWNTWAAIFGPFWAASRGAWGFFWSFLVLELFALVQIVRGLWGELGADQLERYDRLMTNIAGREVQAAELIASGDQAGADAKLNIANNLRAAADLTLDAANAANGTATMVLLAGLVLMLMLKSARVHRQYCL